MRARDILYLAGPIAGAPDYRSRFALAAERLRAAGYAVIDPCDHEPIRRPSADQTAPPTWADWMRPALVSLTQCDGIALLPGLAGSRGAILEVSIAGELGLMVAGIDRWIEEATS